MLTRTSPCTCYSKSPGGGYLVHLFDGDVPFFWVSFSPIFSRTGYQRKANFLEQVVKTEGQITPENGVRDY